MVDTLQLMRTRIRGKHYLLVCFCLSTTTGNARNVKEWMKYVHAFISKANYGVSYGLFPVKNVCFVLKLMRNTLKPARMIGDDLYCEKYDLKLTCHKCTTDLLFHTAWQGLILTKREQYSVRFYGKATRSWCVCLSKTLSTKLWIRRLVIHSNLHLDSCTFSLSISTILSDSDAAFCGVYSNFSYFPGGHKVTSTLRFSTAVHFECNILFDIMTHNSQMHTKFERKLQVSSEVNLVETVLKKYTMRRQKAVWHIVVSKTKPDFSSSKENTWSPIKHRDTRVSWPWYVVQKAQVGQQKCHHSKFSVHCHVGAKPKPVKYNIL